MRVGTRGRGTTADLCPSKVDALDARLTATSARRGVRRLPVLLDDALVNSDAERRGRMLEVLRRMSEHLQVLLFTCHDEDFDRLAAPWQQEVRGRPRRSA